MEEVLRAKDGATVEFRNESRNQYLVNYENNFAVLPDNNTIIGAKSNI